MTSCNVSIFCNDIFTGKYLKDNDRKVQILSLMKEITINEVDLEKKNSQIVELRENYILNNKDSVVKARLEKFIEDAENYDKKTITKEEALADLEGMESLNPRQKEILQGMVDSREVQEETKVSCRLDDHFINSMSSNGILIPYRFVCFFLF